MILLQLNFKVLKTTQFPSMKSFHEQILKRCTVLVTIKASHVATLLTGVFGHNETRIVFETPHRYRFRFKDPKTLIHGVIHSKHTENKELVKANNGQKNIIPNKTFF